VSGTALDGGFPYLSLLLGSAGCQGAAVDAFEVADGILVAWGRLHTRSRVHKSRNKT
jgi:hypothetical protein